MWPANKYEAELTPVCNHNKPPLKSLFGFSHKDMMSSVFLAFASLQCQVFFLKEANIWEPELPLGLLVVEVICFPDVAFAKSCCLSFVLFVPLVLFGVEWSVCKLLLCKLSLKLSLGHFC